jgi:hypothetical protein
MTSAPRPTNALAVVDERHVFITTFSSDDTYQLDAL